MSGAAATPSAGALVLSLDFELHWGVRDTEPPNGPYRGHLLGARVAVLRMLELFREYEVAATWATVGFLFAGTRDELERFSPAVRPRYHDARLDPYREPLGRDEGEDPIHFAAGLVERIAAAPRQEVATHTFSHYYCLEPGRSRESFRSDLASAVALAAARGIELRSMGFPRNQHNPEYDDLLLEAGIRCFRGNGRAWMYRPTRSGHESLAMRGARLADSFVPVSGSGWTRWSEIPQASGLCDVPANLFLRPHSRASAPLRRLALARIQASIRAAAAAGQVFHLWWHPHNFGAHLDENMAFLRRVLDVYAECRDRYGMQSLSMAGAACAAAGAVKR